MLGTSLPQTERQLSHLLDSHLLQETSPNRHKFHDLLADYSIMLMQDEGNEGEGTRVMERLMDFYLFAADIADHVVHPHRLSPAAPHESPSVSLPFERTAADAWAWFEMEREAMLAVGRHARARGNPGLAAVLGQYLAAFLEAGCHWDEAMEFAACSVEHWRRVEHPAALCRSLLSLSAAHAQIREYPAAESAAEEALALARSLRDQNVVAEALKALGVLRWYSGQNSEALSLFEASSAIREEAGDRWELARLDNNLALTLVHMGRKQEAQERLQRAIAGFRATHDMRNLGKALANAGNLYIENREMDLARQSLSEALPIVNSLGSPYEVSTVKLSLGDLVAESGDVAAAVSLYREALRSFRMLGDKRNQANCLIGLGGLYQLSGRHAEAVESHRAALDFARAIGAAHEQTVAYRGLGTSEAAAGDQEAAIRHLREAIAIADRTQDVHEAVVSREALADVLLAAGDRQSAVRVLEQAVTFGRAEGGEALRVEARLRGLRNLLTGSSERYAPHVQLRIRDPRVSRILGRQFELSN